MIQYGANKKGLPLDGFDKLVDHLVQLYKESNPEEEEEAILENDEDDMNLKLRDQVDDVNEEDIQELQEEEVYDIDTQLEFQTISKGQDFISIDVS